MILFPGEDLAINDLGDHSAEVVTDDAINEKYAKGDVRIVTEQARYPLTAIPGMIESGNYELNPEFQRRHRWSAAKQSRLIESFIMNVPIPPIFLYEDRFSHYQVMDGLQRISAIYEFYKDRLAFEGLEEWPELNNRTYSQLPEQVKRGVDRRYLSSIILLQETAKNEQEAERLKQLVFERINSGGISLSHQEARNAIYNGPLNQLCIRLARNTSLCRLWGIPEPDKAELGGGPPSEKVLQNEAYRKMEDVELVLRFFAYRQRLHHQKGALSVYLDTYLKQGNIFPSKLLGKLEKLFTSTVKLVFDSFGQRAFWLYRSRSNRSGKWDWFRRPTTVVFDPLMYVISQHHDDSERLIAKKAVFQERITDFYKDNYDHFEGRYTNLSNISDRNRLFEDFVNDVLGS
jgi:hypothetical protein